jgi:hypothetical protein
MKGKAMDNETVRRFFQRYLVKDERRREHLTVLFFDLELPSSFYEGLRGVERTRLITVDAREIDSPAAVLAEHWDPDRRYLSVHDYLSRLMFPEEHSAINFCKSREAVDYTSFEFPRFDTTTEQVEMLLFRYVSGDPERESSYADSFYSKLGDNPDYEIQVLSGKELDRSLTVSGPAPWMEICGPLVEGDIRFAPGSELFYNGESMQGVLHCDGAINLLPIRGFELDQGLCRRLLNLGRRIPSDPIDLFFRGGRLTDMRSEGGLATEFRDAFSTNAAFSSVVEVGIGLMHAAGPLIREWAAPTNEAVPGVHVGLGADPGNLSRFTCGTHMDFVAPHVKIQVNGAPFYDRGTFFV